MWFSALKSKQLDQDQLPQDLNAYWMPFTPNKLFKEDPRWLIGAEGMYYTNDKGEKILDGAAGLWCVNVGHGRKEIKEAIKAQVDTVDYVTSFQMGNPNAFYLAEKLKEIAPGNLNHAFYTNSGSESVDTALKIALAYHRKKGEGHRTLFIGREKAYHGVGFGGMSVGGISSNRKNFGSLLPNVAHLKTTLDLENNAFSKGLPEHGGIEMANQLEDLIRIHDADNVAAVILEPIIGSGGVVPPPKGYLDRIREICDKHGILLIFDEVITGFGRTGDWFASSRFGITPDIMTTAKGISNGTIPLGAVMVGSHIFDELMNGPKSEMEISHGYTYSGHPIACAAALATIDIMEKEKLYCRAAEMEDYFADAIHSLKGLPAVIDIRNLGLMGGIQFEPKEGEYGARGYQVFTELYKRNATCRLSGDLIALCPPLIIDKKEIDDLIGRLADAIRTL